MNKNWRSINYLVMNEVSTRKIGLGFILVVAGVILLLRNYGFLPYYLTEKIFNWPMLLIAIGSINLLSHKNKVWGLVLVLVGGAFWLRNYMFMDLNWLRDLWPVFIILIGVYILIKHSNRPGERELLKKKSMNEDGDFIDEVAVFGGGEKNITSSNFHGGRITSIFGGGEINLAKAQIEEGNRAVIDVLCIFGGVELRVPKDWTVQSELSVVLGGFEDQRDVSSMEPNPNKVLVIKGLVIFGGGQIKHA